MSDPFSEARAELYRQGRLTRLHVALAACLVVVVFTAAFVWSMRRMFLPWVI